MRNEKKVEDCGGDIFSHSSYVEYTNTNNHGAFKLFLKTKRPI